VWSVANRAPIGLSDGTRETLRDVAQGPLIFRGALVLLITIRSIGDAGGWGPRQVLALSLGMTGCVLVTAGFVYSVGRRVSICLAFRDLRSATAFMRGALALAGACVLGAGALYVLVASAVALFEAHEILTFLLAFLGFSAIWLLSTGLSLLRAPGWVGCGLVAGLGAGLVVNRVLASVTDQHLAAAILVGFITTVGLIVGATRYKMSRLPGRRAGRVVLPPLGYLLSEAIPYFVYGTLYALLLLIPHVLGWLVVFASEQPRLPAIVSLEAGLTLSLPPLVLASGFAEHVLQQFWRSASTAQVSTPGTDPRRFHGIVRDFHARQLARYLCVLGLLSVCALLLFAWSVQSGALATWLGFDQLDTVVHIFVPGVVAYALLGWGLFNCMFALSLARPRLALDAVLLGVTGALVGGVSLGMWAGSSGAVIGAALGGSVAFVVGSTWAVRRLVGSVHYYYATAF
jgi:hypothetical protein